MVYFEFHEDMSEYNLPQDRGLSIYHAGWVGKDTSFETATPNCDFTEKLKSLIVNAESSFFNPIVWRFRGQHSCPCCDKVDLFLGEGSYGELLGASEFFIPSLTKDNSYFISPSLIYHIITEHHYSPPCEFVTSVLAIDENSKFDGERIFMTAQGLEAFLE